MYQERAIGLVWLCLVLAAGCGAGESGARKAGPSASDDPASWSAGQRALAELGDGFLVWESNRSGAWRIWTRPLDGSASRQLSPEEPGRSHMSAHISPDGTRVAYLSYPEPFDTYGRPPEGGARLQIVPTRGGEGRVLVSGARSYGESRAAVWLDAHRLLYLDTEGRTQALDLGTGETTLLARGEPDAGPFLLNPTLTHGTSNTPTFSVYHAEDLDVTRRPMREGCQPYFTRDGRFGFWTTRAGGPLQSIELASERMSTILERDDPRLPQGIGYLYFPMVSPDQRLLAFGASRDAHDHFVADYEIFVAEIDPKTLAVQGDPVRYTFDPHTDRFPDVFLSGLELGHHEGEAPYPVALDPGAMLIGEERGAVWHWDFGDGTQTEAPLGQHVYREPGRYQVTARRGDTVTGASIDVDEPLAPEPLRVFSRGDEVLVVFDEPIDATAIQVAFASGTAVERFFVGPDDHTLHVLPAARLSDEDRLELGGVRDRAAAPNTLPMRSFAVERRTWPVRRDGLAFLFAPDQEQGARLGKPGAATLPSVGLAARGRARRDHHGALVVSGGAFALEGDVGALGRACRDAGAFTVEVVLRPALLRQPDGARLLSLEREDGRTLLALAQPDQRIRATIRTKAVTTLGTAILEDTELAHLVLTYREGQLASYKNGRKVQDTDRLDGRLERWDDATTLVLGSDAAGTEDWHGTIERVALYCRVLEPEEIASNAHAIRELLSEREVVPQIRVRAELVAASDVPTPEQVRPYREALMVHEWGVQTVLEGEGAHERIRVAHWAVLDATAQIAGNWKVGATRVLEIEPFDRNPQVSGVYLSDTLPLELDSPLFLDVSP